MPYLATNGIRLSYERSGHGENVLLIMGQNAAGHVIEAEHLCMTLRGVQAAGARTITSTMLGVLRDDARSRGEFLAAAGLGGR